MVNDISTLDFAAFDTETTGLYPASEALVEIGAVRFNLLTGATEHFQTLVNPGKPIPPQATYVHGITDEMVFEAPSAREALPHFFQFIEGAIPVAHNAGFDLGFLSLHGLRNGVSLPTMPVLDTLMFSRRVLTHLPSHKLETLVREINVPENTFHRALADARSCMEVFRHLVGKSCGVNASWDELRDRHGRLFAFEDGSKTLTDADLDDRFGLLVKALEGRRSVWIQYEGSYGPREVTPHLLYARAGNQYLEATCHLDGMKKSFRLDRIRKVMQP